MNSTGKNQKPIFLAGKKVDLRPLAKADIPRMTCWVNDPEVREFVILTLPTTEEQEEEWFRKLATRENDALLAIDTKDGTHIGNIGIHNIVWKDRIATTGTIIGEKEYWGKGYGTDAKMLVLDYAFNTLNLHKICSAVFDFNERSLQYSLHCGYKVEGTRRKHVFKKGRYCDLIELGVFKEEWLPVWKRYQKTGRVR
ncbi:MAG: GNAT family protein [Patescibacteria group bacterium]